MGKFKKAMKAIGSGALAVGEAIATTMTPQYWYNLSADAARQGRGEEARRHLEQGLRLERRGY